MQAGRLLHRHALGGNLDAQAWLRRSPVFEAVFHKGQQAHRRHTNLLYAFINGAFQLRRAGGGSADQIDIIPALQHFLLQKHRMVGLLKRMPQICRGQQDILLQFACVLFDGQGIHIFHAVEIKVGTDLQPVVFQLRLPAQEFLFIAFDLEFADGFHHMIEGIIDFAQLAACPGIHDAGLQISLTNIIHRLFEDLQRLQDTAFPDLIVEHYHRHCRNCQESQQQSKHCAAAQRQIAVRQGNQIYPMKGPADCQHFPVRHPAALTVGKAFQLRSQVFLRPVQAAIPCNDNSATFIGLPAQGGQVQSIQTIGVFELDDPVHRQYIAAGQHLPIRGYGSFPAHPCKIRLQILTHLQALFGCHIGTAVTLNINIRIHMIERQNRRVSILGQIGAEPLVNLPAAAVKVQLSPS